MCECLFVLEQDMGRHGKRYAAAAFGKATKDIDAAIYFSTRAAAGEYLHMQDAPLFTQGTDWKIRPA